MEKDLITISTDGENVRTYVRIGSMNELLNAADAIAQVLNKGKELKEEVDRMYTYYAEEKERNKKTGKEEI